MNWSCFFGLHKFDKWEYFKINLRRSLYHSSTTRVEQTRRSRTCSTCGYKQDDYVSEIGLV